jgi:hypothetical protein
LVHQLKLVADKCRLKPAGGVGYLALGM